MSTCADRSSKLRVLVLGYIVRRPLGGGTWPTLQYALGLARLGHEVFFLEDSEDYPCCYDPRRHVTDEDPSFGLDYAAGVFERTGLGERWAYHDAHRARWHGPCAGRIEEICASAELLLNVSGINPIRPWLARVPRRAYIDTDPAFEQVRQLDEPARRDLARAHNVFFTLGENIPAGKARGVPDVGLPWKTSRQPVVLERWPVTAGSARAPYTTVMLWESYPGREYGGMHLGMKAQSFPPFLDLPARSREVFELAVGGPGVPRAELRQRGWSVIDPLGPSRDPWVFQRYLSASKGEFTVAKQGYAASYCGWFSERSAHYLASGRPVITQESGFSEWLPSGAGLFAFSTMEEVLAALERIDGDYAGQCRAARELAQEYFDSDRVLTRLVDLAMEGAHLPDGP